MPKNICIIVLLSFTNLFSQTADYPKDYFQKPMDIPLILSGNFGELRDNHFHSGLDYKTQMKEGFPVFAVADGYISRIKIEQYGYGKVLYINHPNGYSTVYAHLKNFNEPIEKFAKKNQYNKENYQIDVNPKPSELIVKKGEIIGYSGNSGSSGGPHLHFEVRDSDTQTPINPMLFGFNVADTTKPKVQFLYAYPLSDDAVVNQSAVPIKINFSQKYDGNFYTDTVYAQGKIGFAVNTFDKQNSDDNNNGIYNLKMLVNGKTFFEHQLDKFNFDESRYINLHIDYEHYEKNNIRLQKCFIEPENELSTYDRRFLDNGVINVIENQEYNIEILIADFEKNITKIIIPVMGKKDIISINKKAKNTNFDVKAKDINTFSLDSLSVIFPKNTFYKNTSISIQQLKDRTLQIHEDIIPLKRSFTLLFDISKFSSSLRKNLFVARVSDKGRLSYVNSEIKDNLLIAKPRILGSYRIAQDAKPPNIEPLNFKDEQWISNETELKLKINDDFSGIKSFRGEINGEFVLMEWNHNTGLLRYNFSDKTFKDAKHQFKLSVTDNVNNTKIYTATFYRANTE